MRWFKFVRRRGLAPKSFSVFPIVTNRFEAAFVNSGQKNSVGGDDGRRMPGRNGGFPDNIGCRSTNNGWPRGFGDSASAGPAKLRPIFAARADLKPQRHINAEKKLERFHRALCTWKRAVDQPP